MRESLIEGVELRPREAIDFFRSKGTAPPGDRFDYRDWAGAAHARGFVVAKAMQDDVLTLIREEVDRAIAEGRTLEQFRADLAPKLKSAGWWGTADMQDPVTGEWRDVQLGSERRLRVIFDTNLKTAYAAGRWQRIQRTKATLPYLWYRQLQRPNRRDEHVPFHDIVLPVDHPFWLTHFPPNGYFCGCFVRQLSERALRRRGLTVTENPPMDRVQVRNRRTGEIERVPDGITPGFDANPGATWMDLAERHDQVARGLRPTAASAERALIQEARARGLRDGRESMVVLDARNDRVIDWTRGDEDSVALTGIMRDAARDGRRNLTLVHNHPGGDTFTLSAPDFQVLQSLDGLETIVAVGHDGSIYRATKQSTQFVIDGRRLNVENLAELAFRLTLGATQNGQVNRADLAEVHAFVVARSLQQGGVIDYRHALSLRASQLYARNRQVIEYLALRIAERLVG